MHQIKTGGIMTNLKKLLAAALIFAAALSSAFAQTPARSYYVSAAGDDENNNGRSEAAPFKTLEKALEMAKMGVGILDSHEETAASRLT
jgi:hypothetical protein